MGEDVTSVRNQAKYMTFLVSAWTVMARAMAAGARSSEPPDRWLPSPLSCSFSTRWYLNRISCSVSWYIVKCYLCPKPERLATGWVNSLHYPLSLLRCQLKLGRRLTFGFWTLKTMPQEKECIYDECLIMNFMFIHLLLGTILIYCV